MAVVNGDVITNADVGNRARLFALSTGLPLTPDVLDRLRQQITRQLIDERLRMQEVLRRKIVIQDKMIAESIHDIETRNGMQPGALRQKLAADGVSQLTLIDQIRTQLGWTQVLREQLGGKVTITDAEVADQQRLLAQQVGKPEYRVGEIFIPVDDPANAADAQRFAETVITELRAGAAFPVVAAQFSQNQTALQGGELGWVQPNQLDPEVVRLVSQMPIGAISNPVKVPGGFSIVTLQAKREIGHEVGTVVSLRQIFLPFASHSEPTGADRTAEAGAGQGARHQRKRAQLRADGTGREGEQPDTAGRSWGGPAGDGQPTGVSSGARDACRSIAPASRWWRTTASPC